MGKDKARRFAENSTFRNMLQPSFEEYFQCDYPQRGEWAKWFGNDNSVTLELGCGRGEYTVALAQMYPERNFIGVDIKGARMWRGAKSATENGMTNVGFLRARIEFIDHFFARDEVSEIWITFPDPQMKKGRENKRLTSAEFLTRYANFLRADGSINLKTDSLFLHQYTRQLAQANSLPIEVCSQDISEPAIQQSSFKPLLDIRTAYETRFMNEGIPITFLRFGLAVRQPPKTPSHD